MDRNNERELLKVPITCNERATKYAIYYITLYSKLFERGALPPLGNHGLRITPKPQSVE